MKDCKCDHIIGYGRRHDDYADGGLISQSVLNSWEELMEEKSESLFQNEDWGYSINIEFSYCPLCGQKLED